MKAGLALAVAGLVLSGCANLHLPRPARLPTDQPTPVAAAPAAPHEAIAAPPALAAVERPREQTACKTPGKPPAYPDGDAALRGAPSIYEQVQLLLAGRKMRMERETALEQALSGCAH